jgi:hypothetical protein
MPRDRSQAAKNRWMNHWAAGLTAALALAAGLGVVLGYRAMETRVGQIKRGPVHVEFNWPPLAGQPATTPDGQPNTWLSEPFRRQLTMLAQTVLSEDPFDRDSLQRTHAALMDSGWFREIKLIHRASEGVVRIDADWRTPVAVVRHGELDYLVSGDGERLPVEYQPGASRLRVISGPKFAPPERMGERWLGGEVQAGLKLLAHLQTLASYAQVVGVDVSTYQANRRLVILTDRGNRIVWGETPGELAPSEPTAETKLKWLHVLASSPDFGQRIDAGKPVIDLTNPRGIMIDVSAQPGNPVVPTNALPASNQGRGKTPTPPPAGRLAQAGER